MMLLLQTVLGSFSPYWLIHEKQNKKQKAIKAAEGDSWELEHNFFSWEAMHIKTQWASFLSDLDGSKTRNVRKIYKPFARKKLTELTRKAQVQLL